MSENMSNGKTSARDDRWHAVTVHRDGNGVNHINSRDYIGYRDWTLVGAWYLRVENDVVVRARGLDNTPRQVYAVCRGAMRNAGGEYTLEAVKRKLRDGSMEIH